MSSPYRQAVAALRERREEVARDLGETETVIEKLTTERGRLRIELDALEARLLAVRRPPLEATAETRPIKARTWRGATVLSMTVGPLVAFGVAAAYTRLTTPARERANYVYVSCGGGYEMSGLRVPTPPDALLDDGAPRDRPRGD